MKPSINPGDRFGCLVVLRLTMPQSGPRIGTALCECDCGNRREPRRNNLQSGNTRTCGDREFHTPDHPRKPIPATVLFDDEDREMLERYNWHINDGGYAVNRSRGKTIRMHRVVLGLGAWQKDCEVDHINGIRTDNRKANLRVVTHAKNTQNLSPKQRSNNTSGYRGVTRHHTGKWTAQVMVNYHWHTAGIHETAEQAGRAAAELRLKLMGQHGV